MQLRQKSPPPFLRDVPGPGYPERRAKEWLARPNPLDLFQSEELR
jgi:hypothetical protein